MALLPLFLLVFKLLCLVVGRDTFSEQTKKELTKVAVWPPWQDTTQWWFMDAKTAEDQMVYDSLNKVKTKVQAEINLLKFRLEMGIDEHASESPNVKMTADPIEVEKDIWLHSRTINAFATMISAFDLNITIAEVLGTKAAQKANLICPFKHMDCNPNERYRTTEGSCNNLQNPLWGCSVTPLIRLMPAQYETGGSGWQYQMDLPKTTSRNGGLLPSPRVVSNIVHDTSVGVAVDTELNVLFTTMGQVIGHDIDETPMAKGFKGANLGCCNPTYQTSRCFPIDVPVDDAFFSQYNKTCIGQSRSAETTSTDCNTGMREQMNQASSYLDLGGVYGPTTETTNKLRTFSNGRLAISFPNHFTLGAHANQKAMAQGFNLFRAGDKKLNEFTGLIGSTLIWYRLHNQIAEQLHITVPSWDDETLFQETRRIMVAIYQHIILTEYMPLTIGDQAMRNFDLQPTPPGSYYEGYDPEVNPSIPNVVATAAGRFGHTMVNGVYKLLSHDWSGAGMDLSLSDLFFRSNLYLLHEHDFMRGTINDGTEAFDRHMPPDLANKMFELGPGSGKDLAAANIQRGRDHGLPSYNDWREYCNLPRMTSFSRTGPGKFPDMDRDAIAALSRVYNHPDSIDVWTGGVSETEVRGGSTGPLFAHLFGQQFEKLRKGDRFWYDNIQQPYPFTLDQLGEIRKSTLAMVLCATIELDNVPQEGFKVESRTNRFVSCGDLPQWDWTKWRIL